VCALKRAHIRAIILRCAIIIIIIIIIIISLFEYTHYEMKWLPRFPYGAIDMICPVQLVAYNYS
jgi:hypothetical protein